MSEWDAEKDGPQVRPVIDSGLAGSRAGSTLEARLATLDCAIQRGLADADAGKLRPADKVFAVLAEKYRA